MSVQNMPFNQLAVGWIAKTGEIATRITDDEIRTTVKDDENL